MRLDQTVCWPGLYSHQKAHLGDLLLSSVLMVIGFSSLMVVGLRSSVPGSLLGWWPGFLGSV